MGGWGISATFGGILINNTMTNLAKIQHTRSFVINYILPFLLVASLYSLFHIPVDNFLYSTSETLKCDLWLFGIFIAATALIYLLGIFIWVENKEKYPKYQITQQLRRFQYALKSLIFLGGICITWWILQYFKPFNNSRTYLENWYYIGIAATLVLNIIFLIRISCFCRKKESNTNAENDKKELKADSVESAVVEIEKKNDPNDPFTIASDGLKSVIDRVYSNSIANLGEGSYIIGVNGEWGSGKSTLIELVKRQMEGDVHIIDFNPWTSHQPANLPVDFFRTVATSIGSLTMRRTMVRYGLALTKAAKKDIGDAIESLFGERSLDSQLKAIGEYIKRRNLKLLIIIDDIDRMDGDEILAVLKLARRSGNLPNTVYLLAFNHEYVESQICQKIKGKNEDVNDSFNYIDKIVNLPFDVPKHTSLDFYIKLINTVDTEITTYKKMNIYAQSVHDVISKYLTNYRAFKKLYNLIITDYYHYKDSVFFEDYIIIRMLQQYDIIDL